MKNSENVDFLFDDVIERLKKAFNINTDSQLADLLGLSPTTFNMRRKRKSLPVAQIMLLCKKNGICAENILWSEATFECAKQPPPQPSSPPDAALQNKVEDLDSQVRAHKMMVEEFKGMLKEALKENQRLESKLAEYEDRLRGCEPSVSPLPVVPSGGGVGRVGSVRDVVK